jgi:hypothetical protein
MEPEPVPPARGTILGSQFEDALVFAARTC